MFHCCVNIVFFFHKRGDVTSCIVKLVMSCVVKACRSMPWGCNKTWRPSLVSLYFVSATTHLQWKAVMKHHLARDIHRLISDA